MSQSSDAYTVANGSGATVRAAINADLQALNSNNSGTSGPASTVAGQWWVDTTTGWVKQRDSTNASWIKRFKLNGDASVDVASAATCDIGADGSRVIRITGTTGITSLGSSAPSSDRPYFVRFAGSLTLTHNATSLILPNNGSNIVTQAGDYMLAQPLGSGNWQVLDYQRASGQAVAVQKGYLFGLTLSNDGVAPNTKIDIAAGSCVDDTGVALLFFPIGSNIDFTINGAGGLDTGALAASTWYHCFAIGKGDGTVIGFASTSLTPTLPAGYSYKRRLGSVLTDGSAHIIAFTQDGDYFRRSASVLDTNATNPGTAAVTRTLSVPSGINVFADVNVQITGASAGSVACLLSDLAASDELPASLVAPLGQIFVTAGTSNVAQANVRVRTNTSSQIRSRLSNSDANVRLLIATLGWVDTRGRLS